jgi:hypothetical protein
MSLQFDEFAQTRDVSRRNRVHEHQPINDGGYLTNLPRVSFVRPSRLYQLLLRAGGSALDAAASTMDKESLSKCFTASETSFRLICPT